MVGLMFSCHMDGNKKYQGDTSKPSITVKFHSITFKSGKEAPPSFPYEDVLEIIQNQWMENASSKENFEGDIYVSQ